MKSKQCYCKQKQQQRKQEKQTKAPTGLLEKIDRATSRVWRHQRHLAPLYGVTAGCIYSMKKRAAVSPPGSSEQFLIVKACSSKLIRMHSELKEKRVTEVLAFLQEIEFHAHLNRYLELIGGGVFASFCRVGNPILPPMSAFWCSYVICVELNVNSLKQ